MTGAVLLEIAGMPKCLDLVASRRLSFRGPVESGVTVPAAARRSRRGTQAPPSPAGR